MDCDCSASCWKEPKCNGLVIDPTRCPLTPGTGALATPSGVSLQEVSNGSHAD